MEKVISETLNKETIPWSNTTNPIIEKHNNNDIYKSDLFYSLSSKVLRSEFERKVSYNLRSLY